LNVERFCPLLPLVLVLVPALAADPPPPPDAIHRAIAVEVESAKLKAEIERLSAERDRALAEKAVAERERAALEGAVAGLRTRLADAAAPPAPEARYIAAVRAPLLADGRAAREVEPLAVVARDPKAPADAFRVIVDDVAYDADPALFLGEQRVLRHLAAEEQLALAKAAAAQSREAELEHRRADLRAHQAQLAAARAIGRDPFPFAEPGATAERPFTAAEADALAARWLAEEEAIRRTQAEAAAATVSAREEARRVGVTLARVREAFGLPREERP
jgi:hypothetical protein